MKKDPIKKVLDKLVSRYPGASDVLYDGIKKSTTKKEQAYLKLGAGLYLNAEKDEKAKSGKRKPFANLTKEKAKEKQRNRCKDCNKKSELFEYHHADGVRANNSLENCVALCPNCHAKRHRKKKAKQSKRKKWFSFPN